MIYHVVHSSALTNSLWLTKDQTSLVYAVTPLSGRLNWICLETDTFAMRVQMIISSLSIALLPRVLYP